MVDLWIVARIIWIVARVIWIVACIIWIVARVIWVVAARTGSRRAGHALQPRDPSLFLTDAAFVSATSC